MRVLRVLAVSIILAGVIGVSAVAAVSIVAPTELNHLLDSRPGTLQSFSTSYCKAMRMYENFRVQDSRDSKYYRVRRMPDGRCWMIDDLKLGGTGTAITLTSANSNVTADFILPANPITRTSERTSRGRCDSGSASSSGHYLTCNGTINITGTGGASNFNFAAYLDPNSTNNVLYENCVLGAPGIDAESQVGCGYLYNWYTATAGTGNYSVTSGDAPSSICPSGWSLPSGSAIADIPNNEFAVLNGAMLGGVAATNLNSALSRPNWRSTGAFSGTYAGLWDDGFSNQGAFGGYWSRTVYSSTQAWSAAISYNSLLPGTNNTYRYRALGVRCVLSE